VAELADAPDLGLRNHRFQSVAFRFKKTIDLREENAIFQDQRRVHEPAIKNVVILAQFLVDEPAWAFERLPNKLPI